MKSIIKIAPKWVLLFCLFANIFAFAELKVPALPENGFIYDENRLLNNQETKFLWLLNLEICDKTGALVAAALMDDAHLSVDSTFADDIAKAWNINRGKNIFIFVSLKDRYKRIILSDSIKAHYPDIDFDMIQQKTMNPAFRLEQYGQGIISFAWEAAKEIAKVDGFTITTKPKAITAENEFPKRNYFFIAIVFVILLYLFIRNKPFLLRFFRKRYKGFNGSFGNFEDFNGGFKSR